jgi:hypothetical protein
MTMKGKLMSIVRARPRLGEIGLADDWSSP